MCEKDEVANYIRSSEMTGARKQNSVFTTLKEYLKSR